MREVSRRSMLGGALGATALGVGTAILDPLALRARAEVQAPTPEPSPIEDFNPEELEASSQEIEYLELSTEARKAEVAEKLTDLDLSLWNRVVRRIGPAGTRLKLVSGKFPAGLQIAGEYIIAKPSTIQRYSFQLQIDEPGKKSRRQVFSGLVNPTKQDLTVSISLDRSTPLSVTARELDRIAGLGANVVLVVLCYISDKTASDFKRMDASRINQFFDLARDRGIRVSMVKPHIVTESEGDGFYRGDYVPRSNDEFFANWERELLYFTDLCRSKNVEYLSLTCEQHWQTGPEHYDRWVRIITKIRATHPALKLTAAFTTHELREAYLKWIPNNTPNILWLLDTLGINSWVRLTNKIYTPGKPNISVNELVAGWRGKGGLGDNHLDQLEWIGERLKMPFYITEVGVQPRVDGLSKQEGGSSVTGEENYAVQSLLYRSIMQGPMLSPWCTGVSIWHIREPFQMGKLNQDKLFPGELAIRDEIARVPGLAAKSF